MIPDSAYVKIWFTEGGCDNFLRIFDNARKQVVTQLKSGRTHHEPNYNQQIQTGFYGGSAYHDPNDPTVVYTNQPTETMSNTTNFIGNNYYQPPMQQNANPQQPHQVNQGQNNQQNHMQQNVNPQQPYQVNQVQNNQQNPSMNYQQNTNYPPSNQNYPQTNNNQVQQQNQNPIQPPPGQYNYPDAPQNNQDYQQMPMGQPMNQNPQQPYSVGMNNVPQYNYNQPGISYYFGVPVGPQVQRNN